MDRGTSLTLFLLLTTGLFTGGFLFYGFDIIGTESEGLLVKNAYCQNTNNGKIFIFNVYNTGKNPIEKNAIRLDVINSDIEIEVENEQIESGNTGRLTARSAEMPKEENIHFEIIHKNTISRYLINC